MDAKERQRRYAERHPDRVRAAQQRWHAKHPNYKREWYEKNRAAVRVHQRELYKRNRQELLAFKTQKGCLDCGERDWRVLQFDHVPERGPKRYNLGASLRFEQMGPALREELAKCDIVCANCHSRRTWDRRFPSDGLPPSDLA